MNVFKVWQPIVAKWEGGAGERSAKEDTGGLTNRGVTIGYWISTAAKIVGKPPTREGLLSLTADEAAKIQKAGFWDKYKIDSIRNPALRIIVAESYWMSGAGNALKSLGYSSISDLNKDIFATPGKLYKRRLAWLQKLSNWSYNATGWTRRLDADLKAMNKIQRTRLMLIGGTVVLVAGAAYGGYRLYKRNKN